MRTFSLKFLWLAVLIGSSTSLVAQTEPIDSQRIVVGAAQLEKILPLLRDKQVALVVNPSSRVGNVHLVDTLFALNQCIVRIFAPEHGFRGEGEAGELIRDGQDTRTGIPIISLYGKKKKPAHEDLAGIDLVVFDIQDVGARFYTYISTLHYILDACAEAGKAVLILDRPNPNGHYCDGPVLNMQLTSFVGVAPLPIVHGCTVGELARLFTGEHWIVPPQPGFSLQVIPCKNYTHLTPYDLPVPPSPNLPNMRAVLLYPDLCLFEGTTVSIGRGTNTPFQILGHPEITSDAFTFVPRSTAAAKHPPQEGWICKGYDLRTIPMDSLRAQKQIDLHWLLCFYQEFPNKADFFLKTSFFDLLAGTKSLRLQIESGQTEEQIRASWQADLTAFRAIREKYLLYP